MIFNNFLNFHFILTDYSTFTGVSPWALQEIFTKEIVIQYKLIACMHSISVLATVHACVCYETKTPSIISYDRHNDY